MRKHKLILFVIAGVAITFAHQASAADLSFTKFHSDITIKKDASIDVTETITANFETEHHGIYRIIPYRFTTLNGGEASIPISITSVTQDGDPARYTVSTDGTNITAKIGNPNETITGEHIYIITYTAQAAVNFFSDHDELYWNVTGDQWDAPLTNISASVKFDAGVTDSANQPTTVSQTACYTGPAGSRDKNCQQSHDGSTAEFSSDDFLTIVVGWPTGAITKPADFDQLRQQGTSQATASNKPDLLKGWGLWLNILLPLIALALVIRRWMTHGRDPGQHRTVIAQYDPPDNLRPAEVYAIIHERTSDRTIAATIVSLAVRGYVKIIEQSKKTLLGLGSDTEYSLQSLKSPDAQLRTYEREILELLFEEHLFPAENTVLKLSDLKKRKYTSDPFAPILRHVMTEVTSRGYFVSNPTTSRTLWLILGLGIAGVGAVITFNGYVVFGLILAGLIVAAFAGAMPKRTSPGVEAAWVGQGFKLFLEKAEKYRVQWQERQGIFEQFLPYAMVFGIADKWAKALSDVATVSPTWYQGSAGANFNTLVLWNAMSNFSSSVSTSVVSAAASGSSGFGGGGFSGGGGGGGGGGGW